MRTIYVRKTLGHPTLRTISIPRRDDGIDPFTWLSQGYAFDGNQMVKCVELSDLAREEFELSVFLSSELDVR